MLILQWNTKHAENTQENPLISAEAAPEVCVCVCVLLFRLMFGPVFD